MRQLFHNPVFITSMMAAIIFGLTQAIKFPYKRFVTGGIENERKRRMANAVICLIPFALGILLEFLYSTFYLHDAVSVISGIGYGSISASLYAVVERFFKVKLSNPYDTEEGQAVIDLMGKVVEDGKIDTKDGSAIKEFLEKIKNG